MSELNQFCTFKLASLSFGIDVRKVQEVIRYQDMTSVPLAPAEVSGLINLRGQIVTAIDLRRRLNLPDREEGRQPMNVVIRTDDGAVSLLVDEIGDVIEADSTAFESAPETVEPAVKELIEGAYKLTDMLLLVLNTEKTISLPVGA